MAWENPAARAAEYLRGRSARLFPRLRNFHFAPEAARGGVFGALQRPLLVELGFAAGVALAAALLVGTAGTAPVSLLELAALFGFACGAAVLMLREFPESYAAVDPELGKARLAALTLAALLVVRFFIAFDGPLYAVPLPGIAAVATIAFGRRLALIQVWLVAAGAAIAVGRAAPGPVFNSTFFVTMGVGGTVMTVLCEALLDRAALLRAGCYAGLVCFCAALAGRCAFERPLLEQGYERWQEARRERIRLEDAMAKVPDGATLAELQAARLEAVRGVWRFWVELLRDPFWGLVSTLFAGFALYEMLRSIEAFFGVLTRLHLLQLSDLNAPLLRRLELETPGTYHHSQMVARLAEAAAEEIGADALLTRVGAYYHDIGKMAKPRYFTENNPRSAEQHEVMSPTLSVLVIHAHVKDGIELGRSLGLPEPIIAFIPEHHGTTAAEFFYRQACDRSRAEVRPAPDREMFRYPGPRPRSRETAIVLAADSVEAASRSLHEPSPARIRGLVHEIIIDKMLDRQFEECPLTLRELGRIEDAFVRQLTWMNHARIRYPARVRTAAQVRLKELDRAHQAASEPEGKTPGEAGAPAKEIEARPESGADRGADPKRQ